jgi:hypothetical protein
MVGIRVNDFGRGDAKREYIAFWEWMYPHLGRAVIASFEEANMTNPTQAEMKDRITKAKRMVDELRNDLKWSKQRIAAELPRLLRERLLGIKDGIDKAVARDRAQDERLREKGIASGVTSSVYTVDAAADLPEPVASRKLEVKLDAEFEEEDLAGDDEDIQAVETAGDDEPVGP